MFKLMHGSDLHYCSRYLQWVDKAFGFAVEDAIKRGAQCAVLSGDSFDSAIEIHQPAVNAFISQVRKLAQHMPVLVLAGTASHDRPGCLNVLKALNESYPVLVADRIMQAAYGQRGWIQSDGYAFEPDGIPADAVALFSALPSINRGAIASTVEAKDVSTVAGEMIYDLCRGWSVTNLAARSRSLPTVLVTHGTINGSVTECAQALVSQDHEFSTGTLFAAETSAVLLGHIHAHQAFRNGDRTIAYPGSITRLIFGHDAPTGYLMWEVGHTSADFEFIETPAKRLIEIEYPGIPDMDDLKARASTAAGAYVRIRYQVDDEHRHSVDREAINALFADAEVCKIEPRINPIVRTRAEGMTRAASIADKLRKWCEVTNSNTEPLLERLELLELRDADSIVAKASQAPTINDELEMPF